MFVKFFKFLEERHDLMAGKNLDLLLKGLDDRERGMQRIAGFMHGNLYPDEPTNKEV